MDKTEIKNKEYRLSRINGLLDYLDSRPHRHARLYSALTEESQDLFDSIEYAYAVINRNLYYFQDEYGALEKWS